MWSICCIYNIYIRIYICVYIIFIDLHPNNFDGNHHRVYSLLYNLLYVKNSKREYDMWVCLNLAIIQHSPMIEDWNQVALGPRILESQPNLTCPWFCAVLIQSVCVRKRDLEVPWGTASFIKSKVLFFQNWKCWMSATWVVKQEKSEIGIRPTFGL